MTPDPWQLRVATGRFSRMLLLASRQSGKSASAAILALHTAISTPNALVLLIARAERQADELFRKILDCYYAANQPVAKVNDMTSELHLANGSRIIPLPGKEDTIRSFSSVSLLVLDEASRIPDALYGSVRPMLAVSRGKLLALTTPWGKRGFFYDEWIDHSRKWERISVPVSQCPRISPEFIEEERQSRGDRWVAQEYELSFEDMVGAIFTEEEVAGIVDDSILPLW